MPQFLGDLGVALHYYAWTVDEPRGVVQIVHGLGEHAGRYAHLAADLNASGYSVYAHDLRGHGETARLPGGERVPGAHRLGPGGIRTTVSDVLRLGRLVRDENPGVPVVLLGHSLGSLISQILINGHSDAYDALVLTGTAFRLPGSMDTGDLSRRHRPARGRGSGFEWLSRDVAQQEKAAADPLIFEADARRELGLVDGLRLFGVPSRRIRPDLPVLIMVGEDDILGGSASAARLARSYRSRAKLGDVQAVVFPGARHEVFNEINRDDVDARLIDWLDAHV